MSVAIIGCGSVGASISEFLMKRGKIENITLIDKDINKINKIKKIIENNTKTINISSVKSDLVNKEELRRVLKSERVVINAASPFFNIPIMEACLSTNTNYIDLASDPIKYPDFKGTSFDEQLELYDDFFKKNLLAISNTGFSPGFTDLLSKYVVEKYSLEKIDYIKIYLGEIIESNKLNLSWSPYIFLLESIAPPTIYKNKKIEYITSLDANKHVKFPEPIGDISLTVASGHPELKTIPDYINIPIDYLEVSGGFKLNKMHLNDVIVAALREVVKESTIVEGDIFDILSRSFEDPDNFIDNYKNGEIKNNHITCLFNLKGKKGNKIYNFNAKIEHNYRDIIDEYLLSVTSSYIVSFVPSLIAEMIYSGVIKERGVIAPAGLTNASLIIKEIKKMGLNYNEYVEIK